MKYGVFILWIIILQAIFYFGYVGNYLNYQHLNQLPEFYHQDIYQYRILSVNAFEIFQGYFTEFLNGLKKYPYIAKSLQNLGTPFYLSLMLFNTIFFLFSYLILEKIFRLKQYFAISSEKKTILILFSLLLIAISQYVLTPYDLSSYLFLYLGIWYSFNYFQNPNTKDLLLLCAIISLSTLNRETSAINISFFALLWIGQQKKLTLSLSSLFPLVCVIFSFLISYIGIRLYVGKTQVIQNIYFLQNIVEIKNLLGISFFVLSLYFIQHFIDKSTKKRLGKFLLLSSPYLGIIFLSGILWEIRLFVPVILPIFILMYSKFSYE